MSFTLFVNLPNKDVCSLRSLASGSSIRAVHKMLELSAGLPAHTYDLTSSDGKIVEENVVLELNRNVWDGFVMRVVFRDDWRTLYDDVVANDIGHVVEQCTVHVLCDKEWLDGEDVGKARERVKDRGVAALFLASFLGLTDLCKALLCVDVDPNGQTPFNRTALFAAMACDHVHVMELLLAHNATLQAHDVDGTSAVEVARDHQARECLRKVRHLKLFSRTSSAASSKSSRASARGGDHGEGMPSERHVIRIPTAEFETLVPHSDDDLHGQKACGNDSEIPGPNDASSSPRSQGLKQVRSSDRPSSSLSNTQPSSSQRPSPKALFQRCDIYTWENNLASVSRASSAAGTYVRIPVPSNSREQGPASGRSSRASNYGVSWSDTVSVSSGTNRTKSVRPSVKDLSITAPTTILRVSSPPFLNNSLGSKDSHAQNRCSLFKSHVHHEEPTLQQLTDSEQTHKFYNATQEPPSCQENCQILTEVGEGQLLAGSISIPVPHCYQNAASVDRDLKLRSKSDCDTVPEPQDASGKSECEDKVGGMETADDKGDPAKMSRKKQQWRRMKRRLKLAEDQKRISLTRSKPKPKPKVNSKKDAATKANFEQWLARKRREKERQRGSSEDESSDDDDGDDDAGRSAENERAFKDWLRDLKERPLRGPHPFTVASLHRRKTRPLKNLIQVGVHTQETVPAPDPDSYMTAYWEWRRARNCVDNMEPLTSPQHIKEAKRQLEEKRKSLLAVALTYEEWMDHSEQREKLMQTILRMDAEKLAKIEENMLRKRRAPRQISFEQWRERVDKREAETRKQPEVHHDKNGFLIADEFTRSSAAIAHEEWLRRKNEELQKNKNSKSISTDPRIKHISAENRSKSTVSSEKKKEENLRNEHGKNERTVKSGRKDGSSVSEDGKHAAWEAWLEQKHKSEVAQLSRHIRKEKQLLMNMPQNKTPGVSVK